ncbi:hypothetical protein GOP47_0017026 [Adiantum capillus-veneris]|uniref:Pentatricopeptide repeat-containing protein n=1 Tax=Adiantum capillus-veneris TaxID=13818 RepID=A0A9D4ZDJ7_ADICA|nr:hypothetical protein GOP47_0017026 [Adiantum capillus-veneris]
MLVSRPAGATSLLVIRSPFSCLRRWIAAWVAAEAKIGVENPLKQNKPKPFEPSTCLHPSPLPNGSVLTYVSALRSCISSHSVVDGMSVHANIVIHSLEHDLLLHDLLVRMYVTCGALVHAHALISSALQQSISSWNILIKAYVEHGWRNEAFHMFAKISQVKIQPDIFTYSAVLSACTKMDDLEEGRLLHSCMMEDTQDFDDSAYTSLITMYGKGGDLESAFRVSQYISVRDTVVWNALISVHVQHGKWEEALSLLFQMQQEGMHLNRVTVITILTACNNKELIAEGQRIHVLILNSKCDTNMVVGTALLNMYSKCGSAMEARRVFDRLGFQDLVSWNAMIATYVVHGFQIQALQLFEQMQQVGVLTDRITFINVLDASIEHANVREVNRAHTRILSKGLHTNVVVATALMGMYGKCGSLEGAQEVFDSLPNRDLIAWNAMLAMQAEHDEGKRTPQYFALMLSEGVLPAKASFASTLSAYHDSDLLAEGKRLHARLVGSKLDSDNVLGNALVNMYSKCECLDDARDIFWRLPERDIVSWNTLISGCAQLEDKKESWQLFEQMRLEGLPLDRFTFISILDVFITQAALVKGKLVHSCFLSSSFSSDVMVGTAVVTMYGKCGSLRDAERAFNNMPKQNIVSWNAFLGTFAQHGQAKQAIYHFQRMKHKLNPDKVTFTIILNACSHAGLVDEGWDIFSSITEVYRMTPSIDHYACMIDLLGRVGRLAEAEDLLRIAPCERNAVLYKTLLGACMQQNDVERAEHAARNAFKFDVKDPTPLVMLSNMYCAATR